MKKTIAFILIISFLFTAVFAATAQGNYKSDDGVYVVDEDTVISEHVSYNSILINEGVTLTIEGSINVGTITINGTLDLKNPELIGTSFTDDESIVQISMIAGIINNGTVKGSGFLRLGYSMFNSASYSGDGVISDDLTIGGTVWIYSDDEFERYDKLIAEHPNLNFSFHGEVTFTGNKEISADLLDGWEGIIAVDENASLTINGDVPDAGEESYFEWYVKGDLTVNGSMSVNYGTFYGWVYITDDLTVNGNLKINRRATVYGDLILNGSLEVNGSSYVYGKMTLNGTLSGTGSISVGGAEGEGTIDAESAIQVYIPIGSVKSGEELAATLSSVTENPFAKYDNVSFDLGIADDIVINDDITIPGNANVTGSLKNVEIAEGGSLTNNGSLTFSGGSLTVDSGARLVNNNFMNLSRTATATLNGSYGGNGTMFLTIDADKTLADKLPGFNTDDIEILSQTDVQQIGSYSLYSMEVRLPAKNEGEVDENVYIIDHDTVIDDIYADLPAGSYGGADFGLKRGRDSYDKLGRFHTAYKGKRYARYKE